MFWILIIVGLSASVVVSQPADSCIFDPTRPHCVSFTLPSTQVELMLQDVCTSQPSLPECTLNRLCSASPTSSRLCTSQFHLLRSSCLSLPSERGCRTISLLCRPASLVSQCTLEFKIPALPYLTDSISAACNVKWDKQLCGRIDDRDPLVQLHTLCLDSVRKSAPACASVVSLCGVDVTASTKLVGLPCVVEPKGITPFLHSTFSGDHVLFEWGTVESFFDYGVVVAAAVFIGLLYELVIALRRGWEEKWVEELSAEVVLPDSIQDTPALDTQETPATDAEAAPLLQGSTTQPSLFQRMRTQIRNRVYVSYVIVTRQVRVRGLRSLLKALEGIALVAVVLLVATFNSVLCLAVVAGLAAGAFLFT